MLITSKSNPLIKTISSLAEKKYRKQHNLYIVEGTKPVKECIEADCEIERIICTEEHAGRYSNCVLVSESVFKSISCEKAPQGVLALVKLPDETVRPPKGNCILLDGVQDSGNVGTVIRTANAAGYDEIYLVNCADPFSPKAVRASMSGIFFVKVYSGSYEEVLNVLKGVPIISTDMNGENIFTFTPPEKFCLCIGSEGNGISDTVMSESAHTVKIPMRSTCESLNAGVSAGIAMYALQQKK